MAKRFKYKLDRRSKRITFAASVLILAMFIAVLFLSGRAYVPGWILGLLICLIALYILSIPRFIRIDSEALEIHCIVELTKIHVEDIEIIRRIDRNELSPMMPLLGSYGFFGYYGYYFNLWGWNVYKVYASKRRDLVYIEDIYEDIFVVNCDEADELIEMTIEARNNKREEIFSRAKNGNV